MPAAPFSISTTAPSKGELFDALADLATANGVPEDAVSAAGSLLEMLPEGVYAASISGLVEAIPPDPGKPGSGTKPYMRVEING